jgi:hypothetical protein
MAFGWPCAFSLAWNRSTPGIDSGNGCFHRDPDRLGQEANLGLDISAHGLSVDRVHLDKHHAVLCLHTGRHHILVETSNERRDSLGRFA